MKIFRLYGELNEAKRFANAICRERSNRPIETVEDLAELLKPMIPQKIQNKTLAQVFQAIRIEVNHELDVLKSMILNAEKCLTTDGRLVIISYHSLEDRLVKNYFRNGNFEGDDNPDFMADRVYAPEADFKKALKKTKKELYSLEAKIPIKNFDMIGFSLQYELSYPTVLAMLEMGNINIKSNQRKENEPIILAII